MKESRKKLLKGIVTAAAAAGACLWYEPPCFFPVNDEGFVDIKRKVLL